MSSTCNHCHSAIESLHHRNRHGAPLCHACASTELVVHVFDSDQATLREDLALKARRVGDKESFLELKTGDSFEHKTGLWRERVQRIDRDADRYDKVVIDPVSGSVIRDCHEPLSRHHGRGSAKP